MAMARRKRAQQPTSVHWRRRLARCTCCSLSDGGDFEGVCQLGASCTCESILKRWMLGLLDLDLDLLFDLLLALVNVKVGGDEDAEEEEEEEEVSLELLCGVQPTSSTSSSRLLLLDLPMARRKKEDVRQQTRSTEDWQVKRLHHWVSLTTFELVDS